jgi:hypothetical protein
VLDVWTVEATLSILALAIGFAFRDTRCCGLTGATRITKLSGAAVWSQFAGVASRFNTESFNEPFSV